MNKMNARFTLAAMAAMALASAAQAATTITVDSVVQRWPWNNKLDITYTVNDGQDVSVSKFKRIVFTAVIGGETYVIDGVSDVGASANTGTHTVTWTAPSGVLDANCTMTAAVYAADAPSGDDYLIVDLTTGAKSYEGLLATQADSNARYNVATYKTTKLALRKVPAGGPYPTGDDANYRSSNSARTWTTDRDYYIGIFPVTQGQYQQITGTNPSTRTWNATGNTIAHRPVEHVSWDDLRLSTTASSSPIPAVSSSGTGTFFQRLNYMTGLYFDLPTEVMSEIAHRAGATTAFFWGDDWDNTKVVCGANSGNCTFAVGSKDPNTWGIYDAAGNVKEWCLDDYTEENRASRTDPFAPFVAETAETKASHGGGGYGSNNANAFKASAISGNAHAATSNDDGFRVALVVE